MLIEPVIAIRISLNWGCPQTGSLANKVFVGHPQFFRVHKGFVIKPRWHQPPKGPHYAHDVKINTRPTIHTGSLKALIEFYLSGFKIGNGASPRAQLNNAIGLFGTMAKYASRAGIFKTAANHIDTIGQERRGQRVASNALISFTIKGEINGGTGMRLQTIRAHSIRAHSLAPVIVG